MENEKDATRIRAVVYARYSSELQSDTSLDDQVRLCRNVVERHGWTCLHAYTDRAMSGASPLRPGYQRLLEDARADQFDIVIAEALDRLTRDQADTATLYKQLTFLGIKIITISEGEITELHVGLKGTMNALFLKDLAHKTRRGLRGRIEVGRSGGGLCYGYDVISETSAGGKPNAGARRINKSQAEVVWRVFQSFALGRSPRRIAFDLNRAGIPGPNGTGWGASTINGNAARGTGILNNELYVGRLIWNRLRYLKDPTTGKRISRLNQWVAFFFPVGRKPPKRDGDHGVPCRFWQSPHVERADTIMKKIAVIFALAFAFTTGMAVVTVVAHTDQALADSASAPVIYPEQASKCDGTSC